MTTAISPETITQALTPGSGIFVTTTMWWDCECRTNFIHNRTMLMCEECDALRDESPASRINELRAHHLHLPWTDHPYVDTLQAHRD